jgi:hypothetical protein
MGATDRPIIPPLNVQMWNFLMCGGVVLSFLPEISPAAVVANFAGGLRRIGDWVTLETGTWSAVETAPSNRHRSLTR